ncbi:N-acetylglucosamine-1-phosphate transferase subunits alpha and beta isoform X2 [Arctopsyche grandis]|uniref:N-acetylglucosamine-1-phosphate transferase subunits alpha and beta isoform X2 n=1 Tax=Arctopsyche grandis TaxID=121162 RepID=UPI00406D7BCE
MVRLRRLSGLPLWLPLYHQVQLHLRKIQRLQRRLGFTISTSALITVFVIIFLLTLALSQLSQNNSDSSRKCRSDCCDNIGSICEEYEPIDAVYTWVNGSDPLLLESMRKFAQLEGITDEDDLSPSRYDDKQELKYSLRSLEKYAPWIRQVFVVTAGQLPSWLNLQEGWGKYGKSRLKLISHEDIIPRELLPTFSSPTIEYFLHKIPGLSERFIYFNDDIFLGDFLHLNDLYTNSDGYMVYTAWSVPECSQGCPWSFLGDNSCDQSCDNTECDYDGGDCLQNPNIKSHHIANSYPDDYNDNPFFDEDDKTDYNAAKKNFGKYPGIDEPVLDLENKHAQQSEDAKLLQHLLHDNKEHNGHNLNSNNVKPLRRLQAVSDVVETNMELLNDKKQPKRLNNNVQFKNSIDVRLLKSIRIMSPEMRKKYLTEINVSKMNESKSSTKTSHISHNMDKLSSNEKPKPKDKFRDRERNSSNILIDGANHLYLPSSHSKIIQNFTIKTKTRNISKILKSSKLHNVSDVVLSFNNDVMKNNKVTRKRNVSIYGNADGLKHDSRRLDVYARSLIHTNKLFNKVYGFQNRKVPAHIPFLLEKKTIEKMQDKFSDHVEVTKKNKFRRPNDFQFAFSYYHYMMSEIEEYTIDEIFDMFDTDKSGTWSDREVRTVLARVRGPPLTAEAVHALEAVAKACDSEEHRSHPTPPGERYLDSEMPTLTKKLISECPGLYGPLRGALGQHKPRAHPQSAANIATFAMLSSNITKAVIALDEIRRDTKKFVCINDNLDPGREAEGEIVRMVLQELYEALLPVPSQWELPQHVANRFLRLEDLAAWQYSRTLVSRALIVCAMLLLFLTIHQTQCLKFFFSGIKKTYRYLLFFYINPFDECENI